ncbi:COX15/CtaA family protein [Rothia sp. LK2588]|uniref:heme A synthase n=1 Tax=Rothia sp. LK2588 TaxID=3114369 RepID=UPI0034CE99D1
MNLPSRTVTSCTGDHPSLADKIMPARYIPWVKTMAYAVVIANMVLIASGGIVRLTGSGLGCDTWPRCTKDGSWTTTPEMGIHGLVEFTNRLLTFGLMLVTILAFLSILRIALPDVTGFKGLWPKLFVGLRSREYRYADLFNLTLLLLWGIPVQAVVGGISVWLRLNPWMITAHYYLTAIMIALAAVYLNRVKRYFEPATRAHEHIEGQHTVAGASLMRTIAWVSSVLCAFLIFMGTVTTGTGPHAGDPDAHRHAFDPWVVTRLHSFSVWAFCAVVVIAFVLARKFNWPTTVRRVLNFVLVAIVVQGIIGYIQFFTGLPIWFVWLHLLGSAIFIWAASALIEKLFVLSSPAARHQADIRIEH